VTKFFSSIGNVSYRAASRHFVYFPAALTPQSEIKSLTGDAKFLNDFDEPVFSNPSANRLQTIARANRHDE
jgi:hypothetical protein